jgi:hypothetical protein
MIGNENLSKSRTSMINLLALRDTTVVREPFNQLAVPNFGTTDALRQLEAGLPRGIGPTGPGNYPLASPDSGPAAARLAAEIQSGDSFSIDHMFGF